MSDFSQFALRDELLEALASQGITEPTPIQQASLVPMLDGADVLAQAKTGSGKTLAFALTLLSKLQAPSGVQALVLCPTRELADQVTQAIRHVCAATRGGQSHATFDWSGRVALWLSGEHGAFPAGLARARAALACICATT